MLKKKKLLTLRVNDDRIDVYIRVRFSFNQHEPGHVLRIIGPFPIIKEYRGKVSVCGKYNEETKRGLAQDLPLPRMEFAGCVKEIVCILYSRSSLPPRLNWYTFSLHQLQYNVSLGLISAIVCIVIRSMTGLFHSLVDLIHRPCELVPYLT